MNSTREENAVLKGKTILLGISGSISAYKMAHLASLLQQAGASVYVIMTKSACRFIDPVVFDTLTRHRTVLDDFDRANESPVSHIDLPKMADAFLVAPASADIIAEGCPGHCGRYAFLRDHRSLFLPAAHRAGHECAHV